jgi:hypothetical protein
MGLMPALPDWTARSPVHLYGLFQRHQRLELSDRELDLYSQLLTHVVAMKFNQHRWHRSLSRIGISTDDLQQETITHLVRKSLTMIVRNDGWKPMMAIFNCAIYNFVMTAIAVRHKKLGKEVCVTDYLVEQGRNADVGGSATVEIVLDEESASDLLGDAAEDQVLGDIVTKNADEFQALTDLYALLRGSLCERATMPRYRDLDEGLRRKVSVQIHGLVTARILRIVRTTEE